MTKVMAITVVIRRKTSNLTVSKMMPDDSYGNHNQKDNSKGQQHDNKMMTT